MFTFVLPQAAHAAGTASITGTVSAESGGAAIANSSVTLYKRSGSGTSAYWSYQKSVRTDSAGAYAFTALDAGSYTLEITAPSGQNYVDEWWNDKATRDSATAISATSTAIGANVALATGATVTGKVTTGGANLQGAYVQIFEPDQPTGYYRWKGVSGAVAQTDASGNFSVNGLRAGTYTAAFFGSEESGLSHSFYGGTDNITLAGSFTVGKGTTRSGINGSLVAGASVSGKVTDSAGEPLVNSYAYVARKITVDGSPFWEYYNTSVDDSGVYAVSGLPAGTWAVRIVGPSGGGYSDVYYGGGTSFTTAKTFALTAGQAKTGVNAVLTKKLSAGTPTITGTAVSGSKLAAKPGTWSTGTTFSYQWYANGVTISGATKSTLTLGSAQRGKQITVTVTGIKPGYGVVAKTSAKTLKVAVVATPTISGTAKVGKTLTAKPGTWTAKTTFTYQWYASGKAISKATKSTFKLTSAQKGKTITVKVTGKLSGYPKVAKTSKATAKVG
ncbi:hypothetical protein Microterr_05210 [Microbacterium terricola]|uniref:Alpha-amylase n=1 Tax=Microbacterium terricola TaxID=344163 RepID=A0ABM8DW72_9MICO|nr:hypothetical protein Microterr_05210 [Microbacterium terricola]